MACNCETQNEINKLYKAYSDKSQLPEQPKIGDYIKHYGGNVLAYTLMLLCFPLLIIYVLALAFSFSSKMVTVVSTYLDF